MTMMVGKSCSVLSLVPSSRHLVDAERGFEERSLRVLEPNVYFSSVYYLAKGMGMNERLKLHPLPQPPTFRQLASFLEIVTVHEKDQDAIILISKTTRHSHLPTSSTNHFFKCLQKDLWQGPQQ